MSVWNEKGNLIAPGDIIQLTQGCVLLALIFVSLEILLFEMAVSLLMLVVMVS